MLAAVMTAKWAASRWAIRCALLLPAMFGCSRSDPAETKPKMKSTPLLVAELCTADATCQDGGDRVEASLNRCPRATLEATPLTAFVGTDIRVLSQTVDPDGDALSFVWSSAPDGAMGEPTLRMTSYRCASAGQKTLQLHVTDARGCQARSQVEVTCIEATRSDRTKGLRARRI